MFPNIDLTSDEALDAGEKKFETIQLSPEFMKEFYDENPEFKDMDMTGWCECEQESDPVFHDNGVLVYENCVDKHHYHCGWCLGLSQIG